MMQADPLQQLRDVHAPPDPGWWPPAVGWWLLAVLAAIALALLLRRWLAYRARMAPFKRARALHRELLDQYRRGHLEPLAYVDRSNEILKRLFVHGLHRAEVAAAADRQWLEALDAASGGRDFTQGPGRALGLERFRREPSIDVDALAPLIENLLARAAP